MITATWRADFIEQFLRGAAAAGVEVVCRCMSNRENSIWRSVCRPDWKFFAASILSNSSRGKRRAGVHVRGHVSQHVPFPAEVFHELAGQLDRIPLHAVDAGHAQFLDLRQQVVQAVAEFMEQGDDFVVGEQRRFAAHRRRRNCS